MFNAILRLCRVENWNWLRLNVGGFPEAFTEKHSPQTAHNLLQDEVTRAEDQSEVISKSFIYTETLCVSFLLSPCIKRQQNAGTFWHVFFSSTRRMLFILTHCWMNMPCQLNQNKTEWKLDKRVFTWHHPYLLLHWSEFEGENPPENPLNSALLTKIDLWSNQWFKALTACVT